jgi:hypothetical protein
MPENNALLRYFNDFWQHEFCCSFITPEGVPGWNFEKGYTGDSLTVSIGEDWTSVDFQASTGQADNIPKEEFFKVYEVLFLYQTFSPLHADIGAASPYSEYIVSILHHCPPGPVMP